LLYEEKGDIVKAKKYFKKVLDLDPENQTANQFLK